MRDSWLLWFLQLSGWPVFLTVVALSFAFALGLSVGLTWLGNRSVLEAALIAILAVTLIVGAILVILLVATQLAFD